MDGERGSQVAAMAFWGSVFSGLMWVDYKFNEHKPEWTVSHVLRDKGHMDTRLGEAAFLVCLIKANSWFIPHMIVPARRARRARRTVPTTPAATNS